MIVMDIARCSGANLEVGQPELARKNKASSYESQCETHIVSGHSSREHSELTINGEHTKRYIKRIG